MKVHGGWWTAALCVVAWALAGMSADAATSYQLVAQPDRAGVGQAVSFTPVVATAALPPGTTFAIDFGDGVHQSSVMPSVAVSHAYGQPGSYVALLLEVTTHAPAGTPVARASIVVTGAAPAMTVLGLSLAWPDGSSSLSISGCSQPPQPVALVRVNAPGMVVVQWQLDGEPFSTSNAQASAAGDVRFILRQPLPAADTHGIAIVVVSPIAAQGAPTPTPPISYSYSQPTSGASPSPLSPPSPPCGAAQETTGS